MLKNLGKIAAIFIVVASFNSCSDFNKVLKSVPDFSSAVYGLGLAYLTDKNRLKVLEVITQLRTMKQEDLAKQLEDMLRQNHYELVPPSDLAAITTKPIPAADNYSADDSSDSFYSPGDHGQSGVRVRLRGKLHR